MSGEPSFTGRVVSVSREDNLLKQTFDVKYSGSTQSMENGLEAQAR